MKIAKSISEEFDEIKLILKASFFQSMKTDEFSEIINSALGLFYQKKTEIKLEIKSTH